MLRAMAQERHWRRVIIVTSKYHTRRAGFAFRRGLEGTGAVPIVPASRYDASDPAQWWRRRADFRFAGSEWVKLLFYRLGGRYSAITEANGARWPSRSSKPVVSRVEREG